MTQPLNLSVEDLSPATLEKSDIIHVAKTGSKNSVHMGGDYQMYE